MGGVPRTDTKPCGSNNPPRATIRSNSVGLECSPLLCWVWAQAPTHRAVPWGQKLPKPAPTEDVADDRLGGSQQQAGCYGPGLAQGALKTRGRFLDCCLWFRSPSLNRISSSPQTWWVGREMGGAEALKLHSEPIPSPPPGRAGASRRHQKRKHLFYCPENLGWNSLQRQPASWRTRPRQSRGL